MRNLIKGVFYEFGGSLFGAFAGYSLIWHIIAIVLTYAIVATGFDWTYYTQTRHPLFLYFGLPAAFLGFLVPIFLPIILFIKSKGEGRTLNTAYALGQAAVLSWIVISGYKFFTGRAHPETFTNLPADITHVFRFGFGRAGIFWGWPSAHTAVAFAISICAFALYPESRKIKYTALIYAFYIGLGVSVSIHWFSDFVAGAIIGSVVGLSVSRTFKRRLKS